MYHHHSHEDTGVNVIKEVDSTSQYQKYMKTDWIKKVDPVNILVDKFKLLSLTNKRKRDEEVSMEDFETFHKIRAGIRPKYKTMKGLEIQKKCKSLQDGYLVKALRKIENMKSGSAASVKSLSLLFKRLQLNVHEHLTENPETQNLKRSLKTSDHTDKYLNYQPPKKKIKLNHFLNHLPMHREHFGNISKKNLKNISLNISEKKEKDKDQLFCLSLYKEIKKLPKALRLKTKIEIYNLISQKQTTTNTSSKYYKIASV